MASKVRRRVAAALLAASLLGAGLAAWLAVAPPDLIRVGAGYTAKIVCSSVFVSGRDPEAVLQLDVQAPGHPLLRLMRVSVDREARTVRAGLLGFAGGGLAVARDGTGCATVPDGDLGRAAAFTAAPASGAPRPPDMAWPDGDAVEAPAPALASLLADPALAGPGVRAIVVLHRGRIVAERYAEGFTPATPLLGWSMTKTVTAALVGTLVGSGRLDPAGDDLLPAWAGDERRRITLAQLLAMASGLAFNEDYGDVTDVTRMLYLEPDMAAFAAAKPLEHPPPGSRFSYASGTSVVLARRWQDAAGSDALDWPRQALFEPIGMRSAVMEADARGTFVGSSYLYATARDWARFALLLLRDGRWGDRAVLPPGWVGRMRAPSAAAPDEYSQGQMWLHGPRGSTPAGQDPDAGFALPDDTVWMLGHDGQSIALVPSRDLAVVRLGLTPSRLNHRPQALVQAVLGALP
jgi:CubicO group peptidase (beta-lactamase class C family)